MSREFADRFFNVIKNEAERLMKSEEDEINPIGVKKDKDGFEYVYSLASLDKVIGYLASFEDCLSKRVYRKAKRSHSDEGAA